MAKFSIFGKLFRFWKIKVFRFWKITSKKQVFQPRKKSDYVGVSKTKTNFYCLFFSNFWPREKKFDQCVFNLQTHLFSIFFVNLHFIFHLRPVWSKNIEKWGNSKHFDEKKVEKSCIFMLGIPLIPLKNPNLEFSFLIQIQHVILISELFTKCKNSKYFLRYRDKRYLGVLTHFGA